MSLKEGVHGSGGIGTKKEGKVPQSGHTLAEAVAMETAGAKVDLGKHNLKEGKHNKGGGKICLGSDRVHGGGKKFPSK